MPSIHLPAQTRALPTPQILETLISTAQLVGLACISRSGTMLAHALLDGHPDIIQVPCTLKYFDFAAQCPALTEMTTEEVIARFCEFAPHQPLFDTKKSVFHRNRLGDHLDVVVEIDKTQFASAATNMLPRTCFSHRQVLIAILAAFAWCMGNDLRQAKAILWHMHHADWLLPYGNLDRSNTTPMPPWSGLDILRPHRMLLPIRSPGETIGSIRKYCESVTSDPQERFAYFNTYMNLYVQDLQRIDALAQAGIPIFLPKMEDLHNCRAETMARIATWLGIDPTSPVLSHPTAFGYSWHGDIFTKLRPPSARPKSREALNPSDPDEAFVIALAGKALEAQGYERRSFQKWCKAVATVLRNTAPPYWPVSAASATHNRLQRRKFLLKWLAMHHTKRLKS